ncbi:MAG: YkgJ family cysteine cluster protein [Coraliomargarita sp.]|nr:YkgJ family cysteine cluster protein [Coraliomargarita sp.]
MSLTDNYDCTNCGACCRCFPIYASNKDAEREPRIHSEALTMPKYLQHEDRAYQLYPTPFRDRCAFLKEDKRCEIYATRPSVCRRFEAGSKQCIEARRRLGIR